MKNSTANRQKHSEIGDIFFSFSHSLRLFGLACCERMLYSVEFVRKMKETNKMSFEVYLSSSFLLLFSVILFSIHLLCQDVKSSFQPNKVKTNDKKLCLGQRSTQYKSFWRCSIKPTFWFLRKAIHLVALLLFGFESVFGWIEK